jgi:2-polyprenyl-3-methyl-5-hydroxy-6-metoxy-1,4-benzoquinol methylase
MKRFEYLALCLWPFVLPLHQTVRRRLERIVREQPEGSSLLDVGGRRSHYTIGLPTQVTITDIPRQTGIQEALDLGVDDEIVERIKQRRSNVQEVLIDDMTETRLPPESYHVVSAIEVLEHVEQDVRFVENVVRILEKGGSFLMTTPNGDFVENSNPDHKRHYTRHQLETLLKAHFDEVSVQYIVPGGYAAHLGRVSWSLRRPVRTVVGMACNFFNGRSWRESPIENRARGTLHLLAVARKVRSTGIRDSASEA